MTPIYCPDFPVEKIHGGNIRSDLGTPESLRELGESLIDPGQMQPVGVTETGRRLWGGRREAAARLVGLKTLKAMVFPDGVTEQEVDLYQFIENDQREDATDLDRYLACLKMSTWASRGEIARRIKRSPGTVTKYLSPSDCPPEAQEAFKAGKLTLGQAYRISTSPEPLVTMRLFLDGETHAKAARKAKQPAAAAVRVEKIKCPLASGPVVTVAGEAVSLEDAIEALVEAQKALKWALGKGYTAKTAQAALKDMAAAG